MKMIARIAGSILLVCGSAMVLHGAALAQGAQTVTSTKEEGIAWLNLSSQQRADLAPLQPQWRELSGATKEKWLAVSKRMVAMQVDERERIQSRMARWASLSPIERGQTRLQFNAARRVSPDTRAEQWKLYNELSEEERRQLAARAVPPAATSSVSAVRHSKPFLSGESRPVGKVNTTPLAPSVLPQRVAPSVVQAQPGATTSLISARPLPPPHQPAGQPKIAPTPKPQSPSDPNQQQPSTDTSGAESDSRS